MERFLESNEDEEWENDFVFEEDEEQVDNMIEEEEGSKYFSGSDGDESFGDEEYRHPLPFRLNKSEDSGDSDDLNTFFRHDRDRVREVDCNDLDIIPNVGLEEIFADDFFRDDKPLDFSEFQDFQAHNEPDAFQIKMEEAKKRAQAAQANKRNNSGKHLSINKADDPQTNDSAIQFIGNLSRGASSEAKTVVSQEVFSSEASVNDKTTTGDAVLTISDMDDDEDEEEEEEEDGDEEGDWDSELVLDKPDYKEKSHKTLALAGMRAQPKNQEPIALNTTVSVDKQEPLLEHLDSCLRKKFTHLRGSSDSQEDIGAHFQRMFTEEEEFRGQDSQHLKDLPIWILSTSAKLSTIFGDESSSQTNVMRAAVEAEIQSMHSDPYFVEQLLERCEDDPSRDSNIYSLEIAVKWIRSVCLLMDRPNAAPDSPTPVASSSTSFYSKNKAMHIVNEDRLGRIFTRCEHLLYESAKLNLEKIVEHDTVLRFELSRINEYLDAVPLLMNRSGLVGNGIDYITNQISLSRLQLQMLEINAHSKASMDLEAHLEELEFLWEELETIRTSWLTTLMIFLPPESPWNTRDRRHNFSPVGGMRRQDELRLIVIQKIYKAIDTSQALSLYHHTHIIAEAQVLLDVIGELQACCLIDKFLVLTKRSPVTMLESNRQCDLFPEFAISPSLRYNIWRDDSGYSMKLSKTNSYRGPTPGNMPYISTAYNAAYEVSIGSQFVEMMLKLSSPSIVRSKLAYAAYCYLRCLQRRQLPWQIYIDRRLTITRRSRNPERSVLLRRGTSDVSFGIGTDDMEYYTEDFGITDLERSIYQAFSDALGPVDEISNLQLLLYEAAVDVLPNFAKVSGSVKLVDISDTNLFTHATPSIEVYQSIHEKVQEKRVSSQYASMPGKSYNTMLSASRDAEQEKVGPSSLLKYELLHFCYALVHAFSSAVSSNLPNCSIGLLEICIQLARNLQISQQDIFSYRKKIFLLAARLGRVDAAVCHGKILLDQMISSHSESNWKEVLFTAETLAKQFSFNAQYELAIQTHCRALQYIRTLSLPCLSKDYPAVHRVPQELLRYMDSIVVSLAKEYLEFGCADKAASTLLKLLMKVADRPSNIRSDQQKIVLLSWIADAYLQLRDFESCNRIVRAIKIVRQQRMQGLMDKYFYHEDLSVDKNAKTSVQSLQFLDYISQAGSSSSHHSMSGYFRSASADRINKPLQNSSASQNDERGISGSDQEIIVPYPDNIVENLGERPHYTQIVRCLINTSGTILPRFCVSHHNVDLGYMLAKIYYESKLYLSALNSLTPTIIGCELLVGGKTGGSKEGIYELGTLYYLRGMIQLDACRSSADLKYPFEVGSSQLFSAIQSISACLPASYSTSTNKRTFIPTKRVRAEAINKHDAIRVSVGDCKNVAKSAITCRRSITYNNPADLLWDAMKWFRRAWEFFHTAGDEVNAARAANRIAECHLLPLFTQSALLGIPLDVAKDLSNYEVDNRLSHTRNTTMKQSREPFSVSAERLLVPLPPLSPAQQSVSEKLLARDGHSVSWIDGQAIKATTKRYASLDEVERVTSFALDIHLEASLPIEIMESYLNFAELSCLQGNMNEAYPFWWETKDLFCYLFADGCLVPIVRRCSYEFFCKIESILDRIVRFLWKLDQHVKNNHIYLMEMHVLLSIEKGRIVKFLSRRARQSSKVLTTTLRGLLVGSNSGIKKETKFKICSGSMKKGGKAPSLSSANSNNNTNNKSNKAVNANGGRSNGKRSFAQILFSVFSCSYYRPEDVLSVPAQNRPSPAPSPTWRRSLSVKTNSAADTLHSLVHETLQEFDADIRTACSKQGKNYSNLFASFVHEKVLDFGWSRFVDYEEMESAWKASLLSSKSTDEIKINISINIPISTLNRTLRYINVPTILMKYIISKQDVVDGTTPTGAVESGRPFSLGANGKQSPSLKYTSGKASPSAMPLGNFAKDLQPLDPFEDFHWMDNSFSPHFLSNASRFKSEQYLSEQEVFSIADESLPSGKNSARDRELVCEKMLIQRIWSFFLKIDNACKQTRKIRTSNTYVNRAVRQSLNKIYQSMVRVRAFSRQFKSNMTDLGALNDLLCNVQDFSDDPRLVGSSQSTYSSIAKAQRFTMLTKAVRLQERLPKTMYVLYINDLVMTYHPDSGKDVIRRLGAGNNFSQILRKKAESFSPSSEVDAASTFQFPPDQASPMAGGIASLVQYGEETQLNMQQTALIFDYCVQDDDTLCGGGLVDRQITLNAFKSGPLSQLLQFLENCTAANNASTEGTTGINAIDLSHDNKQSLLVETRADSGSISVANSLSTYNSTRSLPHGNSSFFSSSILGSIYFGESMLLRGANDRNSGGTYMSAAASSPPECPVPLTLICSQSVYALPWEAILSGPTIIRSLCLMSQIAQILGPRPCFLENSGTDSPSQTPRPKRPESPHLLTRKLSEKLRPRRNTEDSTDSYVATQSITAGVNNSMFRGFLGPAWHQKPYFVSFNWDRQGFTPRLNREFHQRSQQHRAKTALQHIRGLGHRYEHILRNRQYRGLADIGGPSLTLNPHKEEKAPRLIQDKHSQMSIIMRSNLYPTSSLLSDKLPHSIFDHTNFISINLDSADLRSSPADFWSQLDQRLESLRRRSSHTKGRKIVEEANDDGKGDAKESFFPIVLLSYCDLLEMSEAVLYMHCMHRRDTVFVFAPHFIQEKLIVEIKLSLERWCKADIVKTHSTHSSSNNSVTSAASLKAGVASRGHSLNHSQMAISSASLSLSRASVELNEQSRKVTNYPVSIASDSLMASQSQEGHPHHQASSLTSTSIAESEVFPNLPSNSVSINLTEIGFSSKEVILPKAPAEFTASFFTTLPPPRPPGTALPPPPLPSLLLASASNASSVNASSRESDGSVAKASIFVPELMQTLRASNKPPLILTSTTSEMVRSHVPPLPPPPMPRSSIMRSEGIVALAESSPSIIVPPDEALAEGSSRSSADIEEVGTNPYSPSAPGVSLSSSASSIAQPRQRSIKSKERTWAYHALMDAVQRTQKDHAVSIAVFI